MQDQTLFDIPIIPRTSDQYFTPKWLFDTLDLRFDLDPCSPANGPMHTPCDRYYSHLDDGLKQPWTGRVFMNPPFSQPAPWVTKIIEHNNGIALLPFSKSKWCLQVWETASALSMLPSTFKFVDSTNKPVSIFIHTFLAAYGQDNAKALQNVGKCR